MVALKSHMPDSFTPEQNDRLTQAALMLAQSDAEWKQVLSIIRSATDEQTVREIIVLEVQARQGQITVEHAAEEMGQIFEEGFKRRIISGIVKDFVDEIFNNEEFLKNKD